MATPLDPELVRAVRSARSAIVATALLVVAQTAAVVVAAVMLARALGTLVEGSGGWADVTGDVAGFAVAVAVRAALVGATEWRAHRGATRVIGELRDRLLRHVAALGPRWLDRHRGEVATLVTRGLDALEPYLVRYLPQLLQTAILTPAVLVVIATQDLLAAVTIAVVLPLIPVLMWLIGVATQRTAERRLQAQQRLNARVLDLVAGLATLRSFGRGEGAVGRVRELADDERRGTMRTLRIAFLSGAVLELFATLTVAMVAVGVGLRLVEGDLALVTGLTVLILAPEVLTPLRMVGTHFHASADGVAAVQRCLDILRIAPAGPPGRATVASVQEVRWEGVTVQPPDRVVAAPSDLHGSVRPGRVTVLHGSSGSGKTTAALTMLGLVAPDAGAVRLLADGRWRQLSEIDPAAWHAQVSWVPQRPVLEPGSVRSLVAGDDTDVPERLLAAAAARTGFDQVVAALPEGWATLLGQGGRGLSAGQRQRLVLTRTLLDRRRFLVLDEPTAHLDSASTAQIATLVRAAADDGLGVLVLTHAHDLLEVADDVIALTEPVLA